MKINSSFKIKKLFSSDQKDRRGMRFDKKSLLTLRARDNRRKKELENVLCKKEKLTAEDLYMVAMLYQHGSKISDYKKAVSFARRSVNKGFEKAKWLFAAATDRLLMNQGKKQRYGTQYLRKSEKWFLYPVNQKTTDRERAKYNVSALRKAVAELDKLNK